MGLELNGTHQLLSVLMTLILSESTNTTKKTTDALLRTSGEVGLQLN